MVPDVAGSTPVTHPAVCGVSEPRRLRSLRSTSASFLLIDDASSVGALGSSPESTNAVQTTFANHLPQRPSKLCRLSFLDAIRFHLHAMDRIPAPSEIGFQPVKSTHRRYIGLLMQSFSMNERKSTSAKRKHVDHADERT